MANNGIIVEAGIPTGVPSSKLGTLIKDILGMAEGLKREGLVSEHRCYMPVTGNRTERAIMLILECTPEQMDPLVSSSHYIDLLKNLTGQLPNFTTNRVVFGNILDRIVEQSS